MSPVPRYTNFMTVFLSFSSNAFWVCKKNVSLRHFFLVPMTYKVRYGNRYRNIMTVFIIYFKRILDVQKNVLFRHFFLVPMTYSFVENQVR